MQELDSYAKSYVIAMYEYDFHMKIPFCFQVKSKLETSNKTNSGTVQKIKKALLMFNVNKTDKKEEGECSFFAEC